jgi:hypothetical protein
MVRNATWRCWRPGSRPLLGTLLLEEHELTVRFNERGMVSVESL